VALTAHVLASVGWFGAAVVVAFCGLIAAATGDPALPTALYRTMETAVWITLPLGLLAVATGALLSLGTAWGFVRHWWVVAKIAVSVAVIVTDPLVVAPAAREALDAGTAPTQLYGSTVAHCVMLALATTLSVLKPRGRTPLGRRRDVAPTSTPG
jgi:hypothetical protein